MSQAGLAFVIGHGTEPVLLSINFVGLSLQASAFHSLLGILHFTWYEDSQFFLVPNTVVLVPWSFWNLGVWPENLSCFASDGQSSQFKKNVYIFLY